MRKQIVARNIKIGDVIVAGEDAFVVERYLRVTHGQRAARYVWDPQGNRRFYSGAQALTVIRKGKS
jgi:hypothetical protein